MTERQVALDLEIAISSMMGFSWLSLYHGQRLWSLYYGASAQTWGVLFLQMYWIK
jgi:hypothetical protein